MARPDDFAIEGLKALQRAVDQALERKRRLGQYAVFWRDGRVIFDGPDAPKEQASPEPKKETDPGNADTQSQPTRPGDLRRHRPEAIAVAEAVLALLRNTPEIRGTLELTYMQEFIGLRHDGHACNFVQIVWRDGGAAIRPQVPKDEYYDQRISEAGITARYVRGNRNRYQLKLTCRDLDDPRKAKVLQDLSIMAYQQRRRHWAE